MLIRSEIFIDRVRARLRAHFFSASILPFLCFHLSVNSIDILDERAAQRATNLSFVPAPITDLHPSLDSRRMHNSHGSVLSSQSTPDDRPHSREFSTQPDGLYPRLDVDALPDSHERPVLSNRSALDARPASHDRPVFLNRSDLDVRPGSHDRPAFNSRSDLDDRPVFDDRSVFNNRSVSDDRSGFDRPSHLRSPALQSQAEFFLFNGQTSSISTLIFLIF